MKKAIKIISMVVLTIIGVALIAFGVFWYRNIHWYDKYEKALAKVSAEEKQEEFFIACNRDSDLYIGVQQGDNGQSVMLGGVTRDGRPAFNGLSRLCLKACGELKLVDPMPACLLL